MKRARVVCVGEALVDLVSTNAGGYEPHVGGGVANVAIGLAAAGAAVTLVSRVGADPFGDLVIDRLLRAGVDTTFVLRDPARYTGMVVLHTRDDGARRFSAYRHGTADAAFELSEVNAAAFVDAACVHLGTTPMRNPAGEAFVMACAAAARAVGALVSVDANLRPHLWPSRDRCKEVVRALFARADVVKANEKEAPFLTGEADPEAAARALLALGPSLAIVTLGAAGSVYATAYGTGRIPSPDVVLVDAMGAGDAYAAALISTLAGARAAGLSDTALFADTHVKTALSQAARAGAMACTHAGATP